VGGDYLISREKVDRWAKAILEEMLPTPPEYVSFASGCIMHDY